MLTDIVIANEDSLEKRLQQQELMSELSRSFISEINISDLINNALRLSGLFLGVDRMLLSTVDIETGASSVGYLWQATDEIVTAPVVTGLKDLIMGSFPLTEPRGEVVPAILCDDIARDANFHILNIVGVKSVIWAPIYVEGRYWGVFSVEACLKSRKWSHSDGQLVDLIGSIIAAAVKRDITERKLQEALEQAKRASKAKSDFLANMSHEMRTPMNAIIGMTAIARTSDDLSRKDYCLKKIDDASTHLLGVINDILDMSKIEANKFDLSPATFNFENMLQKVVNVVNFRVDERHQRLLVRIDGKIPGMLFGDDQRLSQVITNLLSNAVKFTPEEGHITLSAALEREKDSICTLLIKVTDTGIGISAEQQERLFTSFEQAERGTSRKFGGTGLGLAISKRIVEMMGGSIWIDSEIGAGSTFAFTVNMERVSEEPKNLFDSKLNRGNLRVMAVDDERDIREYFGEIASRLGLSCDVARSGEEACRMIESGGGYDIYFIDWKMPGMDGIELTRQIKAVSDKVSVVIMISSVDWNTIASEAKAAGVDKFLAKPLFVSSVADCIDECLGIADIGDAEKDETDCFEGCRLLLAEDVEVNREIVLSLLEPTKLKIDCAENGLEAVELFERAPDKYDIIFMDVQMPEMDGYEATRRIRAGSVPRCGEVVIVAMTANVFREDVERCIESGMNDHIGKPVDLDNILATLRKYLPSARERQ